jgi:hypothetical protein
VYKISSRHSDKALDVDAAKKDNGANVQVWGYAGTDHQQFIVYPTGDGFYKIIAKHSGKVVEVAGASKALEANVQQWDNNNQTCGQWKFVTSSTNLITAYKDCNLTGFSAGFGVGEYTKYEMGALGMREDAISSFNITEGYKIILYQDDNFGGASTEITTDNNCLNSTWNDKVSSMKIVSNGVTNMAGTYFIQNKNSGLYMSVWNSTSADDGINIAQGNLNTVTNNHQQFKLVHLSNGTYQVLAVHSNKSVDIDGIKLNDGANVQQWTYFGSENQKFIVVPTGDGHYKLVAKHSGKIVEVAGAGKAHGDNIQQWENKNQTCGQWKFIKSNAAPVISITSPTANTNPLAPATVNITTNVTDNQADITKVEFYNGTTLLGTDATAPYSFSWTNIAAGTYTITAKAINEINNSTTSTPITFTVKTITGIDNDDLKSNEASFFPNPTHGIIEFNEQVIQVEVINFEGKSVGIFKPNALHQIDITSLPKGIYILKIEGTNFTHYGKVTKSE